MSLNVSNKRRRFNSGIFGEGALSTSFDHAVYHFFKRYNGETCSVNLRDFLARLERAVIYVTLANTNGSQKDAARLLRIKESTLSMKIKKLHIHIVKVAKVSKAVNEPGVRNL
jgi:DNA-binding NtrC family response regulator